MLKETIICIVSVVIIIIGNNVTNSYAKESMDSVSKQLEELRGTIAKEEVNNNEAKRKMDDIFNNWNEIYKKLAYFVEHDELEKIEQGLTEIKGNIEMEEYQEAVVQSDSTVFILIHVEDKLAFKLENIF